MNALIVCDSLYGNTEQIAQAIAEAWRPYVHARVVAATATTEMDLLGVGLLAIGGPTQKHGLSPAIEDMLGRLRPEKLMDKTVVAFDTRVHMSSWLSGSAADLIAKKLHKMDIDVLLSPESFFVEGKEGPLKKGEIERATHWAHVVLEKAGAPSLLAHSSVAP